MNKLPGTMKNFRKNRKIVMTIEKDLYDKIIFLKITQVEAIGQDVNKNKFT